MPADPAGPHDHRIRGLAVIGAPSSAGAYGPGQEHAPAAFRRHGLLPALAATGLRVVDLGDGQIRTWSPDTENPTAANVEHVACVALELADLVAAAMSDDHNALIIGGDCTVELGTVLGAARDGATVGLAYVDLDADLNTPQTGDGILDWMGLAHLLGIDGAHPRLAALGGAAPVLAPAAVRLFATENVTGAEQQVIDRLGLHVEPLAAVTGDPAGVAARARGWAASFDRILVHVDVDVLDYSAFPASQHRRADRDARRGPDASRSCRSGPARARTVTVSGRLRLVTTAKGHHVVSHEQMIEANRRWGEEVADQGRYEVLDEILADDIVDHDPAPGQGPGREGFKRFFQTLRSGFPDLRSSVQVIVVVDDKVAARYTMEGTHDGEFLGFAPTGRHFSISVLQIARFGPDGKVVERWGSSDELSILRQLGLVDLPG